MVGNKITTITRTAIKKPFQVGVDEDTCFDSSVAEGMKSVRIVHKNPAWKNVALAVKQPWASLICAGVKDIENRTWQTDYRGRLYIVASSSNVNSDIDNKRYDHQTLDAISQAVADGKIADIHTLPQSAVIGYVDIVDCTGENVDSIWSCGSLTEGNVNWKLENAHTFEQPKLLGLKAKLNLFEIPELD